MSLYFWLDLGSLLIPLLFSFHPKIRFYKLWPSVIPAILLSALVYLSWDIPFTRLGVWGFNAAYLSGLSLLELPIEEWLFFICIPYACLFTHYTFVKLMPTYRLSPVWAHRVTSLILVVLAVMWALNLDKAYTATNAGYTFVILATTNWLKPELLRSFFTTFLILLIPFFLVNGILTGSFIHEEVVWYNNAENLGVRIMTVPVEDIFYALGLLLLGALLTELIRKV